MQPARQEAGFSLVEMMVVVGVIAVLAAFTVPRYQQWQRDLRAKQAVRSIADLMQLARAEAIRTRVNHAVFFWLDPNGNPLLDGAGNRLAGLVVRDDNGNGLADPGEPQVTVAADQSGTLAWGTSLAGAAVGPAPNDPDPLAQCCGGAFGGFTFVDPANNAAQWVVFFPDGIPRAYSVGPFAPGGVGSGAGGVYVTVAQGPARDYAVVLSPLGSARVHPFDATQGAAGQWVN